MTPEPESAGPSAAERLLAGPLRRLSTWGPHTDGRAVVLAAIGLYLGTIATCSVLWGLDLWPFLGVPPGPSLFFDARNLTAAWECNRLGHDPLFDNPCDPWGRPLMYLRPWLLLGVLGLDHSHTVALSVVLVVSLFVSLCILVGRVPAGTGLLLALAACSPAVMLAVERANMDIALFSLLAASAIIWRAFPGPARIISPLAVLVAATAKLYPVFALPAFLAAGSRAAARVALLCIAVFAAYLLFSLRDVRHVAAIATQGDEFSYGARILIAHLYHQVGADSWPGPAIVKQLIAAIPIALLGGAIAIRVHRRFDGLRGEASVASEALLALLLGALIYLGTFATVNSFDYRLVFLLLTLPQLLEWVRMPAHPLSVLASGTLAGVLLLLWVGSLSHWLHLWDELASWGVAGLLAAVVAATSPRMTVIRRSLLGRFATAPMER